MKTKPVIVIFVDWFYPGYLAGGPVQSVVSLIDYLNDEFDFRVITTDRDLNSTQPYEGIIANQWTNCALNCKVYYADPALLSKTLIRKLLKETPCRAIYINGLFSKYFSILPLLILKREFHFIKVIVAPRGMFSKGALSIKKFKKRFFFLLIKITGLYSNLIWHAASSQESKEIKSRISGNIRLFYIPNLPKKLSSFPKANKQKETLRLFFSSRISSVKNLLFALTVLKEVKSHNIIYTLYGLIEDNAYWKNCLELISLLPPNIKVEYKGSFSPDQTAQIYENEEVLFLPTLNENYGHSIVESLLCGCPVIISDQTPWKDVEAHGAGFALPLSDKTAFINAIEKLADLNADEFSVVSKKAIDYIRSKIDIPGTVSQYKSLFNEQSQN